MELVALNVNGRTYNIAVEKNLDPALHPAGGQWT